MSSLTGKVILVTGASGFIGSHLASRIQQIPGSTLILLSRKPCIKSSQNSIYVTAPFSELAPATWANHGVPRIDLVFHLGGFIPKKAGENNMIEPVYRDNILGTRALLASLPNVPEKVIYSSTVDVYAPPQANDDTSETSPLKSSCLYGASKLFCEQVVKAFSTQQGCGYAILRYGHIFGPGEVAYSKLIPETIRKLLRNESPILYGDGSIQRDFLYVEDAVEATIRAAAVDFVKLEPTNIVRGQSRAISEYVEILARLSGFKGMIKYLADKPGGTSLRFSNQRMFDILGRWDLFPLEEGFRREIEYFSRLA